MREELDPTFSAEQFATRAVHAGQLPDPDTGAVVPPLSLSTTFVQHSAGVHRGFDYSRSGNPTRANFEIAVASLERGKHGIAFASGIAATAAVLGLFRAGDGVLCTSDVYGGTFRLLTKVAASAGVTTDFVDLFGDAAALQSRVARSTKLLWIETPTNPTMRLVDIAAVSEMVRSLNPDIVVAVDNTFMSPYFQNPLVLGADIVVHSTTKYINGHSDVVGGIVITNNAALGERLKFLQNASGAVPSPFDCYLAHRGLKTLHLRMGQHHHNALTIAHHLSTHPIVSHVYHPGLATHPQHALALRQCTGFSGMLSFRIRDGSLTCSNAFLRALRLFSLAESLGAVESLACLPSRMTHASLTPEARKAMGVDDELIRLSVGIEDVADLIRDLDGGLEAAGAVFEIEKRRRNKATGAKL
ncbi:Cys/Met metabolism PLP-dependent enzyme-domain-containing protein [Chytriomyces sp. MP71]|nr:Cys/Met metabolism PLP-dependent enzyme-domain-containing protein [Chytriomyces sp. MP71]